MKTIRHGTFETNSSSTHALVILTKEEHHAWTHNEKTLNLYTGEVKDLTENDKKIIRNEDGSVLYENQWFESEYDFLDSDEGCDAIDDSNASFEYVENFADVEQKELDDKIIMSIYRGERW